MISLTILSCLIIIGLAVWSIGLNSKDWYKRTKYIMIGQLITLSATLMLFISSLLWILVGE